MLRLLYFESLRAGCGIWTVEASARSSRQLDAAASKRALLLGLTEQVAWAVDEAAGVWRKTTNNQIGVEARPGAVFQGEGTNTARDMYRAYFASGKPWAESGSTEVEGTSLSVEGASSSPRRQFDANYAIAREELASVHR